MMTPVNQLYMYMRYIEEVAQLVYVCTYENNNVMVM